MMISLNSALYAVAAAVVGIGLAAVQPSEAALQVDITGGQVEPMPIALPVFIAGSEEVGQISLHLTTVIANDLGKYGLLRPLPPQSYIEQISDFSREPRFGDWRTIQAQALVTGQVVMEPDGRLRAEFR